MTKISNVTLSEFDPLNLVGTSPAIHSLQLTIDTVARSDGPVIITGESGTGKELVARNLHARSDRSGAEFVVVNCAAFSDERLERELFGAAPANGGTPAGEGGAMGAARGGTLLLDEVTEMSAPVQAKLLRLLELGRTAFSDVRLLASARGDLRDRVHAGQFREDLYYRLKVFEIQVPPLCERRADLPALAQHFHRQLTGNPKGELHMSPRAWGALMAYRFPGNVLELKNIIKFACAFSGGEEIDLAHLPPEVAGEAHEALADPPGDGVIRPLSDVVREFEHQYLLRALSACGGRKGETARRLGISRKTLWNKLAEGARPQVGRG